MKRLYHKETLAGVLHLYIVTVSDNENFRMDPYGLRLYNMEFVNIQCFEYFEYLQFSYLALLGLIFSLDQIKVHVYL